MRIVWREVFRVITNGWFTVGGHRCWVDEILKKTKAQQISETKREIILESYITNVEYL